MCVTDAWTRTARNGASTSFGDGGSSKGSSTGRPHVAARSAGRLDEVGDRPLADALAQRACVDDVPRGAGG